MITYLLVWEIDNEAGPINLHIIIHTKIDFLFSVLPTIFFSFF